MIDLLLVYYVLSNPLNLKYECDVVHADLMVMEYMGFTLHQDECTTIKVHEGGNYATIHGIIREM